MKCEGKSFWVQTRGGRGRTLQLPTLEEEVGITEAVMLNITGRLTASNKSLSGHLFAKIQMFWFIHPSHWNCSIMYKHPHIWLYTYLLQRKREVAWRLGLFSEIEENVFKSALQETAGFWPTGVLPLYGSLCTLDCWLFRCWLGLLSLNRKAMKSFKFN